MSDGQKAFIGYQLSINRTCTKSEALGFWDTADTRSREAWEKAAEYGSKRLLEFYQGQNSEIDKLRAEIESLRALLQDCVTRIDLLFYPLEQVFRREKGTSLGDCLEDHIGLNRSLLERTREALGAKP